MFSMHSLVKTMSCSHFRSIRWRRSASWAVHCNLLLWGSFWRTLHSWRKDWKGQVFLHWWKVHICVYSLIFTAMVYYFAWVMAWFGLQSGLMSITVRLYHESRYLKPSGVLMLEWAAIICVINTSCVSLFPDFTSIVSTYTSYWKVRKKHHSWFSASLVA